MTTGRSPTRAAPARHRTPRSRSRARRASRRPAHAAAAAPGSPLASRYVTPRHHVAVLALDQEHAPLAVHVQSYVRFHRAALLIDLGAHCDPVVGRGPYRGGGQPAFIDTGWGGRRGSKSVLVQGAWAPVRPAGDQANGFTTRTPRMTCPAFRSSVSTSSHRAVAAAMMTRESQIDRCSRAAQSIASSTMPGVSVTTS